MAVNYGSLPFAQQSAIFRAKANIPTERWNDIVREAHDTGFMVAGAIKADLLADLKAAMQKAIDDGTTLREFRKDFDALVAKNGWTGWTGEGSETGKAWRTRVIYETNLRTSYQAGRWAQFQAGKADRPYLMYRHSHSVITPREQHVAWDGKVIPIDDPWWQTHYPPNGYGCKCTAYAMSDRDLAKLGKTGPDAPPHDGTYDWTDKATGEVLTLPAGIQPYWDYAPGASLTARVEQLMRRKAEDLPADIGKAFVDGLDLLKHDMNANAAVKLGVKHVDFAGRKDIADFVTPVLASLQERGLPVPDHVLVNEAVVVRLAEAAGDKPEDVEAAFTTHKITKETYFLIRPHSLYWTKPLAIAQTELKKGYWSTGRKDHALLHELGHLLHYLHVPSGYAALAGQAFTVEQQAVARRVSGYAAVDPKEFVAETFVLLMEGANLDDAILALYDQYGGRRP